MPSVKADKASSLQPNDGLPGQLRAGWRMHELPLLDAQAWLADRKPAAVIADQEILA